MNICWCCWCCSWCNRSYFWSISRRSFCAVLIFTDNCHCWSFTNEWFLRYEGYGSICRYCVSTNTLYCLGSCTIVESCWNIIVHRHTAVTFSKFRLTSLCSTLDISWFSWCCSWSYWCHSWCVLSCDLSTVLINTFNRYAWSSSSEWFFWNESYGSIWRNSVCSFTIYCLSRWAIFKCCRCIIIHWNIWITWSEGWCTCLRLTLFVSRCCIFCSWCNWCYGWCICRRSFSSVHIFTNHCYSWCSSDERFFWYKGYCTICCYCVGTNAINCLGCWAIVESCWNIIVHWHTAVTFSKFRLTCLCSTLDISWFSWSCCWSYWGHSWCVLSCDFSTVLINTFNRYACSSSSEWFFWDEGYGSIWRNGVSSFTIYCLRSWTIFEGSWCIFVDWNIWISLSEGWFTCLCCTLDICRCRIFRSWNNRSNLRCISCFNCSSICISCLNLNWDNITWIRFICWCESNYTCIFINCVCTDHITCWWFRFYWCCWLTIFIKKSNRILVNWSYFITFSEGYSSSLNKTLRSSRFSWCCCWSYWCHSWCVFSCDFSTVLINTFNRYAWSSSSEWFFWYEGYCSIWRNGVCTFSIYCLSCWTIFESSWSILIDWNIWISLSEGWFTCLSGTLDICWCRIFRSWDNWSNLRCVCCFYCCSICISCLNFNWDNITWIRFICWCECHNTCFFIDGESTNHITCWWFRFYWSSWLTRFIKKGNWILVNWSNWVAFSEGYGSSLNKTLWSSRFSWSCSWVNRSYCWCISCRSLSAIHIFTNNCYGWCFTSEWFLRNKGYCSVWGHRVCTNTINCLSCWTIFEGCWNVIVHWYTAVAFSKFRLTCLSLTLLTCWCCVFCSWCNWCYSWCVCRRSLSSVLIFTNDCYCWGSSDERFFWYKGYCTICCYCVGTNTINCLRSWTIIKCCWNIIVHWHTAVTFGEYRFTSLCSTLDISCFSWCSCRGYWCHSWSVLSCDFSTVLIHAFYCYACSSSSEWFFWNKCYGSIWRNGVSSFTIYGLSRWTIFEGSRSIFIDWNIWIAFREGWFTCLSLTLNICRCSIFRCWDNWSNLRCVCCFYCCSICISCLNLNRNNITWVRFIRWCEGHNTSFFINSEGTDHITCWWFRFYRCCWLTIFIKKGNWILVNWSYFITFSEGYCSSLHQTLRTSWFCWCCSWNYWGYCWCVLSWSLSAIHIFANNRYGWCFTSEWFFWNKCYCSVCGYCVGTNTVNSLSCWTILEGCWNVIVHWNTTVTLSKYRLTCLSLTLFTSRCCIFRSRSYWCHSWCVSRWSFSTVHVFTNDCDCWCCACKWFLRNKCHSSVCCYCVSTNAVNCLSCWTIVKCCWNSFIDSYRFLNTINSYCSTLEFRFTCLSGTLDICCLSWCCCRRYRYDFRRVGCIYLNTVWTFSLNLGWCYYTSVRFICRCESDLTSSWIDRVRTDFSCTIFSIGWRSRHFISIFVQKCVAIIFDCNSFILAVYLNSCSCKGWYTCLSGTLDIFWSSWFSCRNSCYNRWCVCCIGCNGCSLTVRIGNRRSRLNRNTFSSSNKVFLWSKCNRSSRWVDIVATFTCYCHSRFISRLTSCWIYQFLACDLGSLIVTQIKSWCLSLRNILNILRYLVCRSNCNWCHWWCVSRWSFSTIHVFTNDCNCWGCACKAWVWNKCHCSICCYCVGTDTINCLSCWAIVKCCSNIIIHRHTAVTCSKFRFTCLSGTLNICWFSWCCSWRNRCHCWCVSRWSFSTIHVFTNDCNCWGCACKAWVWNKCHRTICCYRVSTNAVNCLSCWTIVKCCWNSFIDSYRFLNTINSYCSTLEFGFTSLCSTLDICCFSWSCCRRYWYDFRRVGCIYLDTVRTFSLNLGWCYYTCVWFICRCESNLTCSWIDRVSTDFSCTISCISWSTCHFIAIIIQKRVAIIFNGNSFIFTIYLNSCSCKGWSTCLSRTLDIFWSCRACCWNSCYNSWCVSCIRCDGCSLTVSICNRSSRLHSYSCCSTYKIFFWSKCNCSSRWINCIATFTCYCYSSFISRLTSRWIHQFLACNFCSLVTTQIKSWCLGLRNVLNIRRNLVCRSHCDRCYSWCVLSCCCLNSISWYISIFIVTNPCSKWNSYTSSCSSKAWFWSERHLTSCRIDCICSFTCYCYRWIISHLTSSWIH